MVLLTFFGVGPRLSAMRWLILSPSLCHSNSMHSLKHNMGLILSCAAKFIKVKLFVSQYGHPK